MSTPQQQLLTLSEILASHENVTHFAISHRFLGRGDFFQKLRLPDRDIRFGTYERMLGKFSSAWPDDLEWPSDIPRPPKPEKPEKAGDAA